jgi:phosphoribosylanthranilate isomerase
MPWGPGSSSCTRKIDRGEIERLKARDSTLTLIKSLVVGMHDDKTLERILSALSPFVATFDPKPEPQGGMGKTHDWRVSRRLVELSDRPVILAGGLDAE